MGLGGAWWGMMVGVGGEWWGLVGPSGRWRRAGRRQNALYTNMISAVPVIGPSLDPLKICDFSRRSPFRRPSALTGAAGVAEAPPISPHFIPHPGHGDKSGRESGLGFFSVLLRVRSVGPRFRLFLYPPSRSLSRSSLPARQAGLRCGRAVALASGFSCPPSRSLSRSSLSARQAGLRCGRALALASAARSVLSVLSPVRGFAPR